MHYFESSSEDEDDFLEKLFTILYEETDKAAALKNFKKIFANLEEEINFQDDSGETLLLCAIKNDHPEIAKFLLSAKADFNLTDDQKNSPLCNVPIFSTKTPS